MVGSARDGAPEFDGCDAADTPWSELQGGAEWGELVSPLDMEVHYQQRSMPAVGVARGVGVGAGQGLTGASVPRTPLSAVQRLEQRVTEQSPPSVGSPEWSRGAAQEKRQQQERVKDNDALREAANSSSRSNGSSDGSNSSGSGSYVGSSSSSNSGGDEVVQGRVESRYTRQKTAAAREAAAEKSTGGSSVAGPATCQLQLPATCQLQLPATCQLQVEELTDARRVAAAAVKIVPPPSELDLKVSSGASGGLDGPVSVGLSEEVTHQLRPAGTPGGFSDQKMSPLVGATQAAAARSSPGREDSSVLEGRLKAHRAAPGGGESVFPNLNVSALSQQSVDLQTVDRLHVSDAVAGGGDALNVHNKGMDSIVGLSSTVGSTVDHSERQLLQLQLQHGTA